MNPQQIDALTNALVELHTLADRLWPGLTVSAVIAGVCRTVRRMRIRRSIRRLQTLANHPAHRNHRRKEKP